MTFYWCGSLQSAFALSSNSFCMPL